MNFLPARVEGGELRASDESRIAATVPEGVPPIVVVDSWLAQPSVIRRWTW
jgi:hypothetical protein